MRLTEKNLIFDFDSSLSIKYDETEYYRKKFQTIENNPFLKEKNYTKEEVEDIIKKSIFISAVDFITIKDKHGYLLEIKDYRDPNTKVISYKKLIPILIKKILSTLSSIIPMKVMASDIAEKNIAKDFSQITQLTIVFHIELPSESKLGMAHFRKDKLELALKRKLLPICNNLYVVSTTSKVSLPWTVKDIIATP